MGLRLTDRTGDACYREPIRRAEMRSRTLACRPSTNPRDQPIPERHRTAPQRRTPAHVDRRRRAARGAPRGHRSGGDLRARRSPAPAGGSRRARPRQGRARGRRRGEGAGGIRAGARRVPRPRPTGPGRSGCRWPAPSRSSATRRRRSERWRTRACRPPTQPRAWPERWPTCPAGWVRSLPPRPASRSTGWRG